jgi:hypothetical protein
MPEYASSSARNYWEVAGISVTGTNHLRLDIPCQDENDYDVLPCGVLIAVVADGAGSALHPELGAQAAVKAVLDAAHSSPSDTFDRIELCQRSVQNWVCKAREAVEDEARKRNVCPRELATTLIIVIGAHEFVVAGQIGDGATVIRTGEGNIDTLTTPMRGEYANETLFITSPGAEDLVQLKASEGKATQIAAFSDGLQTLALQFPDAIAHERFFAPLFDFIAQPGAPIDVKKSELRAFLESPRIRTRVEDDLTLILAHRG